MTTVGQKGDVMSLIWLCSRDTLLDVCPFIDPC